MLPLLVLVILLITGRTTDVASLSNWMQTSCQMAIGPVSSPLTEALICGIRIPAGASKDWLLNWGLIHLFVVSGAHFLFLEQHLRALLARGFFFKFLFVPLLLLYAVATGGEAPVIRSGLSLSLHFMSRRWGYQWSSPQVVFLAGILSFILIPSQQYLSLQLSWTAALLLTVHCSAPFASFKKAAIMWWGLLPLLSGLTWSHPVSVISNLLLGSLFQPLLFPLVWVDQMLLELKLHSWLGESARQLLTYSPTPFRALLQDSQFKWLYLFSIQGLSLFLQRRKSDSIINSQPTHASPTLKSSADTCSV